MSDEDEGLRWRLELLKTRLEEGKIHIASHLAADFQQSLSKVQYGPDGKIDLSTVDSRIRATANALAGLHIREEEKKAISLSDIAQTYFEIIEVNLGFLAKEAKERGYSAGEFAHGISQSATAVKELAPGIPKFLEMLGEFWTTAFNASEYHIQDLQGSKAVFGGDLFPSYQRNIASTTGLYIDTTVLTDPFWHTKEIFDRSSKEQQVYYLVKHAINVLQYKELATASFKNPIVVVSPFRSTVDEDEREFISSASQVDALKHAAAIFDREFSDIEDLLEFSKSLDSIYKAVASLANPSRLLFDSEWTGTPEEQIERALSSEWNTIADIENPGILIASQCIGRMSQATDLLFKSRYLSGVPLVDAPTSWQYFNWKLEYNSALEADDLTHLHMTRGLQHVADTDEQWLGNIPPEALIEMRNVGAFEEIRSTLSEGIEELARVNPTGFFRTSDKIVDNIRHAFDAHMKEVEALRKKKLKFAGHDLGTMIAAGAIDIASIAVGTPTFGAASFAVNQLIDAPKLREIPEKFRTLKNAHLELKKSPMGLLFKNNR